jgi:pyruvate/2-oxoglutarate/acetoin dehydrogenase E1 component
VSDARQLSYKEAVLEAIDEEMDRDETVFMLGQTVSEFDDCYNPGISRLARKYGQTRMRPTGLVERLEAGAGVGAALAGMRPIVDLFSAAFASVAYDEVFAKAGLWTYEHGGNGGMRVPIVFRLPYTSYGTSGAEHCRSPLAQYMHGIGLATVVPTTPADAKGLMKSAIRADFPVAFFEPGPLAQIVGSVPDGENLLPFGSARIAREGSDCTIVAVGYQVTLALEAAAELEHSGIDVEIIDPRTLVPLDIETIVGSVRKTGRLVEVDEDFVRCGVGAEIAFQVQERAFDALRAPAARVAPRAPSPASPVLNRVVMPTPEKIVDAVRKLVDYKPRQLVGKP